MRCNLENPVTKISPFKEALASSKQGCWDRLVGCFRRLQAKFEQFAKRLVNALAKSLKGRVFALKEAKVGSIAQVARKMWKNEKKALDEHRLKEHFQTYASLEHGLPALKEIIQHKPATTLQFAYKTAEAKGVRPTMEDAHFIQEMPQGLLAGVFDGHGGSKVSIYASDQFAKRFPEQLEKSCGNVYKAFQNLINEIHAEVARKEEWKHQGTTAVVCFIDKGTHKVYTATLGDSEANIYRKMGNTMKSIPLSCVRDWSSQKDAARAARIKNDPSIAIHWPKAANPKALRIPFPQWGVNVSRAIGDLGFNGDGEEPGVIQKAKITLNQVRPGDRIVIACDGVKDYVPEQEIAEMALRHKKDFAQKLLEHTLGPKKSQDNVTLLVLDIN